MKKAWPIIIVAVIVGAGLAYYFISKNTANSNSTTTTTGTSTNTPAPASTPEAGMSEMSGQQGSSGSTPQTSASVTIADMAFAPANITVKKGAVVTWTNNDSVAHTVTETDSQDGPKSHSLRKGQSYTFTFNTAGTFKYHCTIHPNMTGTVTVTE